MRNAFALVTIAIVAAIAASASPTASAATCGVDPSLVANATVTYRGTNWGPVPLWTVEIPSLNGSWDVHANSEAEARSTVAALIATPCAPPPPPPPPPPPSSAAPPPPAAPSVTATADQMLATAAVTYRGTSWGPVPLWTVEIPSLNASWDVYANSDAEARSAARPYVVAKLTGSAAPAPAAPAATAAAPAPAASAAPPPAVAPVASSPAGLVYSVAVAPADTAQAAAEPATSGSYRLLAAAIGHALNRDVVLTPKTSCSLGRSAVECWKLWSELRSTRAVSITAVRDKNTGTLVVKRLKLKL